MRDRIAIIDINTKKFKAISYKQYDENNILQIVVLEDGIIKGLSNYMTTVRFQLPSGKIYKINGTIENNTIKVVLTSAILNEYGKVIVEVELANNTQVITTFSMYLNVEKSINKELSQAPGTDPETDAKLHMHSNLEVLDKITQEMIDIILSTEELIDLNYQKKIDENLETDDKTVVGAINEVNEKVNNINVEDIDLSGYVSKVELEEKEYVTNDELESKGYLTEHQDISGKADKSELFSKDYNDLINKPNIPSLEGYATEDYVKNEIESALDNGDIEIDLSEYATKDELEDINAQVDKNANDISTILGIIDEPPTYTNPTLTISSSPATIQHNTQTNITLTPRFTQNDAGAIISYSLSKGGQVLYTNTTASAYTDSITLQHGGSVTYTATVHYSDGVIKNTLLGIQYPNTSIKEGNISSNTTVRCYALSYYGVIDGDSISDTNGLSNVLRTSRGSTLTFNMTNQRVVYMYPKSFGNLTSIKDANNFDYINSYTLTNMTLNNVEYNVYILTDAVTINGFKQIFS